VIVRSTTALQVEQALRDMILDGKLEPGTHLVETQLAQSLGVSRNTLREALRSLVEQGLLTHHPHRGVVVTDLSFDDVADLFRLRQVLEGAGLQAIGDDGIAKLGAVNDDFASTLDRGAADEALEHDFAFHRVLVSALESARLTEAHARAQRELRLVMLQLDRDYETPQAAEHAAIVEPLRRGDRTEAAAALSRHLSSAADRLLHVVRMRKS
jgi:DNA-binding GntR family transcriptional regulator